MLALIAILVLTLAAATAFGLHLWRPPRGYAWLAAAAGSLAAWALALAAGATRLSLLPVLEWQPQSLLPDTPALILDLPAWSLLAAVLTLNLAAVFTGIVPGPGGDRPHGLTLSAGLFLSAAAALAVLAGSLLTLALFWSLVDLAWLVIWLARARSPQQSESAVIAFSLRLVSNALVVWAGIANSAAGHPTALTTLTLQTAALLSAAAALRLGLLPPHRPLPVSRVGSPTYSLETILWLAGAAPAWLALVRVGQAGLPAYAPAFLLLGALGVIYAGLSWVAAPVKRAAHTPPLAYWMLGISALALGSAARGQGYAALAWGVAGLLVGGLIGLAVVRPPRQAPVLLIGAVLFSALPFTPAWPGVALYGQPFQPLAVIYLLGHGLLLIGYVRWMLRPAPAVKTAERYVWLLYPLGLALLPLSHAYIAWRWRTQPDFAVWPGWIVSGLTVVGLGVVVLGAGVLLRWRGRRWIDKKLAGGLPRYLELSWLYRFGWWLFRRGNRVANFISWALEGRAGLLWALLALALLISLLAQMGSGSG